MISIGTLQQILFEYGLTDPETIITPHGNGLINNTWKVSGRENEYILQRINDNIFKEPSTIENNIRLISEYLNKNYPGYLFAAPLTTNDARQMVIHPEGYFRLFPFIKDSHTIDVATKPEQAFEAARQFGLFTKTLTAFPVNALGVTIADFHNLSLRGQQFKQAGIHGNPQRIKRSVSAIQFLLDNTGVIYQFEKIRTNADFKLRVTHHDTKISNVLFTKNGKGLCVIDLDTVMPGYFISDVGDMMRTYFSPANEEEKDLSKIEVREDFFRSIARGYLEHMSGDLSDTEKNNFVYAGKFMIYMQALRFLTDYLNNDTYYGAKYEDHNYIRANNQIALFKKLVEKENLLNKIVKETLS
jgi:thiamine kinase-like enzyme